MSRKDLIKVLFEQETIIHSIVNLVPHLKNRTNFSSAYIRERLHILNSNWDKCRQLHVILESLYTDDDADTPFYSCSCR